jgi:hypothetical protein
MTALEDHGPGELLAFHRQVAVYRPDVVDAGVRAVHVHLEA